MESAQIEQLLSEFRRSVNAIEATGISQLIGEAHYPAFLGRSLSMMCGRTAEEDSLLTGYFAQFPTETKPGERKLLFNFFLNYWEGSLDVLEIGPFLGGTSRAIAMGMLSSPNRRGEPKLHTYDKFRDYYQPQQLLDTLAPMFAAGLLGDEIRGIIEQRNSFKEVYDKLHSGHEYSSLIESRTGILPATRDEQLDPADAFKLADGAEYSAVFIDGAKSWYGTKHFMSAALAHTRPGAYYIFQDYGAHTCFWIPVFLELAKEHFRLVAHVDHTYVYQQRDEFGPDGVEAVFPDAPEDFTVADFQAIFRNLYATALATDNTYTLLNYQLQHAAALGYIGHVDEARNRIVDLLKTPYALQYRDWIQNALRVPTYRPSGNVNLF